MLLETSAEIVNRLLAYLPSKERKRMLSECELVDLEFGDILCERDEVFHYAYFPINSFISVVTTLDGHPPLEMGIIGNEGMLGASLALGVIEAPMRAVVQGQGSALRIGAKDLQRILRDCPSLLRTLHRYVYVTIEQLSQTAACNHFHEIEPRLARWLLLTHDRAHADHFHLTHEFLADMLGVRRSGITVAAGSLHNKNLIDYSRGDISILDRAGLEAVSCECYQVVNADYLQQFPL